MLSLEMHIVFLLTFPLGRKAIQAHSLLLLTQLICSFPCEQHAPIEHSLLESYLPNEYQTLVVFKTLRFC